MKELKKRRLYKDNPVTTLNLDGTVKTFQQKVEQLNRLVHTEPQMMTREFLEELSQQLKELGSNASQALKELHEELGISDE